MPKVETKKEEHYLKKELYELIKKDENIFDFIQESSLDGMWYWDLENPQEEWMNPKFWAVLGYDHNTMPHKAAAWQDIIHPDDLTVATDNFLKHCENPAHPYDQTVRYTHKNGSTVWIRCRGLAIRNEKGKAIRMLGAHQDVTAYKNSEIRLQNTTSLLHKSQKIGGIGSWEIDLETNEVLWTEELYKMYGFDLSLPVPRFTDHKQMFTEQSWKDLVSAITRTNKEGTPYELELETIRTDGTKGWIWIRGEAAYDEQKKIIGLLGIAQDITKRKTVELEKAELAKRLEYALDASGDGIWDLTVATEKTIYSKAWIEMLGHTVEEIEPKVSEWTDRLHPEDVEWVFSDLSKITGSPEHGDVFSHEYRFRNKAGQYLWMLNKGKVVERDEKGAAIRVVGTHTNITERKEVEKEIQASESRLRSILNSETIFIIRTNLEGYHTYSNNKFIENFGHCYAPNNGIVGGFGLDSIHKGDHQRMRDAMEALFTKPDKEVLNIELRKPLPNGGYADTLWNFSLILDYKGMPYEVQGMGIDISDRVKVEEQIKRTSLLLNEAQRMSNMGAWELDLITNSIQWTDEVYNIYEVGKDFDHNKENAIDFYHPDYKPIISKAVEDCIKKQIPYDLKCKFITAKNKQLWVRSSGYPLIKAGKVVKIIGMFKDITREEADKEIIIHEQMFSKQLLENMADGFSVISVEKQQISVNKAFCEMTGFSEEELIGKKAPFPYWPQEEIDNLNKALQKMILGDVSSFELTFRKKDGQRFPVLISTSVLKNDKNEVVNYFANITDISRIKEYVSIIEGQNERLRNFTFIVSHNLRSHSSNINGLLDVMSLKNPELSDNQYVQYLNKASENLENTLHNLNEVVSVVSSKQEMESVKLNRFVDDFQSTFQSMIDNESVNFINTITEDIYVEAVPAFLDSIVTNLITNAMRFRDPLKDSYVKIFSQKENGHVILAVEDNGLGLDLEKYKNKLFGMNKTFHKHKDSKGIGLYLTKNQVESMGGKITVDSQPKVGSTFKVYFKNGTV